MPEAAAAGVRLYAYYRVAEADVERAVDALHAAMHAICARHPGLAVELLERPEPSADGDRTLMEAWSHRDGVAPSLQADLDAAMEAASATWRRGPRHVERFVPATARAPSPRA